MQKSASMLMAIMSLIAVGIQTSNMLLFEFDMYVVPPIVSAIFWPLYQISLTFFFFTLWQSLQRAEQPVKGTRDA